MVKNSSTPDPWGNNQHAVNSWGGSSGQQGASSGADRGRPAVSAQSGGSPSWGTSSAPTSWGSPGSTAVSRELVKPPYAFLWVAFGSAILALVLAALPGGLPTAVIAWVLAGFIGFGAAVLFVQRDARRQAEVFYARDPRAPWLYRLAIVLSFVAVVAAAVRIALIIGRMG